jgi:dTDP-glucose 4,6-dehydratase
MRLLATGAAGFIGSNFVRKFSSGSYEGISSVTVLDKLTYAGLMSNLPSFTEHSNIKFIKGDICDLELLMGVLAEFDGVVNFAAESHVDRSVSSAAEFVQTNVVGVQTLLDAIKMTNPRIRFLQVSTDEVYGSIQSGSWDENSPILPNSPYSASKAGGELLARSYFKTHNLDVVVTRCSNNYGPHHFPEKLIPLFITNLIQGKKIPVYGSGKNVRDWLHVDDHCQAIYSVLMNGDSGEIYNVGGGTELTNLEITHLILESMGSDESSIEYVDDRKGHDFRYSVDWTKINKDLGYEPTVKFEKGLLDTVDWYRQNPNWWYPLKQNMES